MKKKSGKQTYIMASIILTAIVLGMAGCAGAQTNSQTSQITSAASDKAGSGETTSAVAAGMHNLAKIKFQWMLWTPREGEAETGGTHVTHMILQKNASSKELVLDLPWQVHEVASKLKDCTLTYQRKQQKTSNAPVLRFTDDTLGNVGEAARQDAAWYSWEQHDFSSKGIRKDDSAYALWPLGVYDSPKADQVIAEEYDRLLSAPKADAYSPKETTFGKIFGTSDWQVEKIMLQKCKRNAEINADEDDGTHTLTDSAEIAALLSKLQSCKLERKEASDSENTYGLYFFIKGKAGSYCWEDNQWTTSLGFEPKQGMPIGPYVSSSAERVIDSYTS
ncbi:MULTISPECIES: hypothetical protein [Caproicibacterium]|uniref:Lipoprotein n=1 Tax=Caproicibacterium argilliputei TaxID=3030016 RepID=A0AA97D7M2_9FIRM|nr:hypothetical protein [Caproicibacterium argilliputei]WOC31164.1 hypothetical protein PXC00_07975 [Caproicibacterium argilliputei]